MMASTSVDRMMAAQTPLSTKKRDWPTEMLGGTKLLKLISTTQARPMIAPTITPQRRANRDVISPGPRVCQKTQAATAIAVISPAAP